MSTAAEIELAIRQLPPAEARAVAKWLEGYLSRDAAQMASASEDAFAKWRGKGKLPLGRNADDYLQLIRDGNGG